MLQTLELQHIRSYTTGLFEFSDGVNIVVGPNASGKTNLLDAVYMLVSGASFKGDDTRMLQRDHDWGRIDGMVDGVSRVVKLRANPFQKSYEIDDVERRRLPDKDIMPVVLFEPLDLLILGGEPERRRNYIDTLLSQTDVAFARALKEYKRTLSQRNRLLKQENFDPQHLFVWDIRLSELGGQVAEKRSDYCEFINKQLTNNYRSISGTNDDLELTYETKNNLTDYSNSLLANLKRHHELDRARGFTGDGPHRDDLLITINGNDVRQNASRGESRSIILALKLAELHLLEQSTGQKPLLLLDDVFSELDGKRRRTLAQTLQNYQTIITTTDADVVIDHFSTSCNIIPLTN